MKSAVQMATYPATAHTAAHTACATAPSNCSGRREATIVPTAAAPHPKATCRTKGALARLAARRTSRIHSRSINEPPRRDIDPLPRHPATPGLTALEIPKTELASQDIRLDDVCMLPHTSGTTGTPKGVMLTHGNITWNVINFLSVVDFRSDDVTIAIAPFFRTGGHRRKCAARPIHWRDGHRPQGT